MYSVDLHPMRFKTIKVASGNPGINVGSNGYSIKFSDTSKFVLHILGADGKLQAIITPGENEDFPQVQWKN